MNADQYSPYGAGKIAGAAEERSRIIKLLDEAHQDELYREGIIALINGENK
jgi:hypothetical protein